MTKIEYTALLEVDYPEHQIDQFGYARLRDQARNRGLVLVGDVTRVHDVLVHGVPATQPDGEVGLKYVEAPVGAVPDAREVRWEIEVEPVPATTAVVVHGVVTADTSQAALPDTVTREGGLVEFVHGLGPGAVTAAFGDAGPVGYSYSVEIDDNRQEILLPAGAHRLEATRSVEDPE